MDRRARVLDAAITVLGTKGLRQLTHRTVDTEAGLPMGSTSNVFRSRDALIAGILDRLLTLEMETWRALAGSDVTSPADFAAGLTAMLVHLTDGDGRHLTLARHAIMLEAAFSPALQEKLTATREDLETWAMPWMTALGSTKPREDLWTLLATLDGLMFNHMAAPAAFFAPEAAIAAVLRGIGEPR